MMAAPCSSVHPVKRRLGIDSAPRDGAHFLVSESLLQRVAQGDTEAVSAVLDTYGGLVWSLARRMSGSRADAEDAVQEVFIDVWASASRYDPSVGSEATFISMIARRRLIDRLRYKQRRPEDLVEEFEPLPVAERDADVSGGSEISEEARQAEEAIAELPEQQQRVLRMSVCFGLSHEKIAIATDLPLGTVKTHIRRGLIRVREKLAERGSTSTGGVM